MSIKCLMNGLEVNYPCSPVCALFGDCVTAFEAHKKENVRTNADRIRAMSDEELAESLSKTVVEAMCYSHNAKEAVDKIPKEIWEDLVKEYLEWLRQPADQDENGNLPKVGRWIFWNGWVSNHDLRVDDAVCSECGYRHPTVRWEEGDPTGAKVMEAVLGKLAKECPGCGAKMIGGDEGER